MEDAKKQLDKLETLEPEGWPYLEALLHYSLYYNRDLEKAKQALDRLQKVSGEVKFLSIAEEYYGLQGRLTSFAI